MFVLTTYLVFLSGLGTLLMAIFHPFHHALYLRWCGAWCVFSVVAGIITIPFFLMLSVFLYLRIFAGEDPAVKTATYLATFTSMPVAAVWHVPGPPGINYILDLTVNLMIMMCLFGPAVYRDFTSRNYRFVSDKYDAAFLRYNALALFLGTIRAPSVTGGMRVFVTYILLFGLVYYFGSRHMKRTQDITLCLVGLIFSATIVSLMAALEQAKFWYLFPEIEWGLGMGDAMYGVSYLVRAGMLRAQVTTGHPIALGVYMVVAITGVMYLWDIHKRKTLFIHVSYLSLIALLTMGIINSVSKGAYLGLVVAIAVYAYLRVKRGRTKTAAKWATILVSLFIMWGPSLDSLGEGTVGTENETLLSDTGSFSYRSLLLSTALKVMLKNPLFGSSNAMLDPDMEVLRQGQGIIDITNFYLGVGLNLGYLGLFLFLIMWIKPQFDILMVLRRANHTFPPHLRAMGASLVAGSFSLAVMMTTVSGMGAVPFILYAFIMLCVVYLRHVKRWALETASESEASSR